MGNLISFMKEVADGLRESGIMGPPIFTGVHECNPCLSWK